MLSDASETLLVRLETTLGAATVRRVEPRDIAEPRGLFHGRAAGVLMPRDTAQVSTMLAACNAAKVGVVPLGGGTGLVGGQVMPDGPLPVILSLERMNRVLDILPQNNTMLVEAGAILETIQNAATDADRLFPLTLAAQGSCQIGGNLATNAGGVNVLRYGNARALCLGLEAVLADGTVISDLTQLRKDNSGYDLRDLMIGSEGTLGVITRAVLRLFSRPTHVETAFLAVASPQAALDLLNVLNGPLSAEISAFELIHRTGLDFMEEAGIAFAPPFSARPDWMVLIECGAGAPLRDRFEAALMEAMEAGLILDAVLAQNMAQRTAFWQLRERIPEGNKAVGSISSHDISVPVADVPAFITRARALVDPALRINCFGHLGDGNLHYNVFPPKGKTRADYAGQRAGIARAIYDLLAEMGGSFSAEHGVGRLKTDDMLRYTDPGRLAAMRTIKTALDPVGIMNPGAVLPIS